MSHFKRSQPQTHNYNLRPRTIYAGRYALAAKHIEELNHIYDDNGKRIRILDLLKGENDNIWKRSMSNELGRLTQGNKYGVKHTNTMKFIPKDKVPMHKKVTYANFRADYKPLKPEPYRIRYVVGGDKLHYFEDTSSPTTNLTEVKLLLNSTISDARRGARFCSVDLKDFFLASHMQEPEYMRLHISFIPDDIIDRYGLMELVVDDYVYIEIMKGMYGLKQAALLAHRQLKERLAKDGYFPIVGTSGMWRHATRKTKIVLCIDDFGIKYYSKADLDHFLNSIAKYYEYTIDRSGEHYLGLKLDWCYDKNFVDISMPGYIDRLLKRLKYPPPKKPQASPHEHLPFTIGVKGTRQYA